MLLHFLEFVTFVTASNIGLIKPKQIIYKYQMVTNILWNETDKKHPKGTYLYQLVNVIMMYREAKKSMKWKKE